MPERPPAIPSEEKAFSPEKIENIMEMVRDINVPGIAFTILETKAGCFAEQKRASTLKQ